MSRSSNLPVETIESDYLKIDRLSYSAFKMFDVDRVAFHKKYILKEDTEDPDSDAIRFGTLIDKLRTEKEDFDKFFCISSAPKPTGQLIEYCKFMFDEYIFSVENKQPVDFEKFTKNAYEKLKEWNGGKLQKTYEKFIEYFNADGKAYYYEMVKGINKQMVSTDEIVLATKIGEEVDKCEAFNNIPGKIVTKHRILFEFSDFDMKCEFDEISVDDIHKILYPIDYKCTAFVEDFAYSRFLGMRYYIQSGLYKFALMQEIMDPAHKWHGYKVENMAFKVIDSKNYFKPLLYKTTDAHFEQSFLGFYNGNKYYRGINEIAENIKEHIDSNEWRISSFNKKNGGVVILPTFKNSLD